MHLCCLFSHPKQLFKLLICGLCFVFNSCCLSCYCFLSFSGMLGLPSLLSSHGLSPPTPSPRKPAARSYMHNIYALNNTFIVFLSNCKGHFLSSWENVTPFFFCTVPLAPFLHCMKYKWLLFTFQAMSNLHHQEVSLIAIIQMIPVF